MMAGVPSSSGGSPYSSSSYCFSGFSLMYVGAFSSSGLDDCGCSLAIGTNIVGFGYVVVAFGGDATSYGLKITG